MRRTVKLVSLIFVASLVIAYSLSAGSGHSHRATAFTVLAYNVEVTIDYGNSSLDTFTGLTAATVFDALNQTTIVTYTQFAYGKFIDSVNGVSNNEDGNGYYWQYWVNDELAPIAADNYLLSDNDHVLWKYCAPEHTITPPPATTTWITGAIMIGVVGVVIVIGALLISRKMK